jgi:outer membrane protein OmpA-like peptidoglycan-associated protein
MPRRSQNHHYNEDLNIWSAFTDLMSNAFMILLFLLLIVSVKYTVSQISNKNTRTPPIILIKDEGAYRFASGSAELPQPMYNYIWTKIVPEIERKTKEYNINTVEIIGHTDGQANGSAISNLDQNLENVANGDVPIQNLKAGSNADLGLMRSLALVRVLRYIQTKEHRLQGLKFRAYSAAQLILPSGEFAQPSIAHQEDATRRRIEIRFTRLGEVTEVK